MVYYWYNYAKKLLISIHHETFRAYIRIVKYICKENIWRKHMSVFQFYLFSYFIFSWKTIYWALTICLMYIIYFIV